MENDEPRVLVSDAGWHGKPMQRRSRSGCIPCRRRRKRCPEDFALDPSTGRLACGTCVKRKESCILASRSVKSSTGKRSVGAPSGDRSPGASKKIQDVGDLTACDTEKDVRFEDVMQDTQAESFAWLDAFLEEFIQLQEPTAQSTTAASTAGTIDAHDRELDEPTVAIEAEGVQENVHRWSKIYEAFLSAIIDMSAEAGDRTLSDHLLSFVKMSNVGKASMVACCLAYSEVVLRRREDSRRKKSTFDIYMIEAVGQSGPYRPLLDPKSAFRLAQTWLRYSLDEYLATKHAIPVASRLLSLFNIRMASVCLLGSDQVNALAGETHKVLDEMQVDLDFLAATIDQGPPLAITVLGLAIANIMDTAVAHGIRPALRDSRGASTQAESPLWALMRGSVTVRLCHVTAITFGLVRCLCAISNLTADMQEGLSDVEKEKRGKEIQAEIMATVAHISPTQSSAHARIRIFCLHEMWRQSLLIRLYQDVYRLGPNAARLQHALEQILHFSHFLSSLTNEGQSGDQEYNLPDEWDMSMVWFLACTVAMTKEQRTLCMAKLEMLGPERTIVDNIRAVKGLWREMDETGTVLDWRATLAKQGRSVSYTF